MPRDCSSTARPRTVVIPEPLMSSTMPRRCRATCSRGATWSPAAAEDFSERPAFHVVAERAMTDLAVGAVVTCGTNEVSKSQRVGGRHRRP